MSPQEWLSPDEAAEILGVSPGTVRRLLRTGQLPGQQFGKLWRIPRSAVKPPEDVSSMTEIPYERLERKE